MGSMPLLITSINSEGNIPKPMRNAASNTSGTISGAFKSGNESHFASRGPNIASANARKTYSAVRMIPEIATTATTG